MFILKQKFSFEASHQLLHHQGKCARVHGHSWQGEILVSAAAVKPFGPDKNMVMDFRDLRSDLDTIVHEKLDHHHLNDTLMTDSPTCEFVAEWLYNHLQQVFKEGGIVKLLSVQIMETCSSGVVYARD